MNCIYMGMHNESYMNVAVAVGRDEERRNSEMNNLKSHTKSEIQTSWGPSTLHSHSVHHGHHPSIYHEFTFVP